PERRKPASRSDRLCKQPLGGAGSRKGRADARPSIFWRGRIRHLLLSSPPPAQVVGRVSGLTVTDGDARWLRLGLGRALRHLAEIHHHDNRDDGDDDGVEEERDDLGTRAKNLPYEGRDRAVPGERGDHPEGSRRQRDHGLQVHRTVGHVTPPLTGKVRSSLILDRQAPSTQIFGGWENGGLERRAEQEAAAAGSRTAD